MFAASEGLLATQEAAAAWREFRDYERLRVLGCQSHRRPCSAYVCVCLKGAVSPREGRWL